MADDVIPADPGLAQKLAEPCGNIRRAMEGAGVDADDVREMLSWIDQRLDCSDFRMATILTILHHRLPVSDELADRMRASVLGFKYWMDEPGDDGMCMWSENHQAMFASCEHLAGQLYPDERFTNTGMSGRERSRRGAERLHRWLDARFRFGFSEWNSNPYYEEDVAALTLVVEHSDDEELVLRATMVLDLLLLDLAMHSFEGCLVGTMGRCYTEQKQQPESAHIREIIDHAFGTSTADPDIRRLSSLFVLARRYRVPQVLRCIAADTRPTVMRTGTGLDVDEVAEHFADPLDVETAGAQYWLMEAFTHPDAINATMRAFREWGMRRNPFLAPLKPLATLENLPGGSWLLPLLMRLLNPRTSGIALQRANIVAQRTLTHHLSSVQHHHPGEFGDQQHVWQATLPGPVSVFSTHPGEPMFDSKARNFSPAAWVGNGVMPDVAQEGNTLLALHHLKVRRGALECKRHRWSHLHFPFVKFDRTRLGSDWVAGQSGEAMIGVRALRPVEMVGNDELRQYGDTTGWAVCVVDALDFTTFQQFVEWWKSTSLVRRGRNLTFRGGTNRLELRWRKGLWVNGRRRPAEHPRFDTPWVKAPREAQQLRIECHGHSLELDWARGTRTVADRVSTDA